MVDGTYNPGVGVETGSSLVLIATASLHDKLQASERLPFTKQVSQE